MKHFLSVRFLNREEVIDVIIEAMRMLPFYWRKELPALTDSMQSKRGKKRLRPQLACWFEEPSTRTWGSFEAAARRAGFRVAHGITPQESSLAKDEPSGLTLRNLIQQGTDVVVLRSKTEGLGLHLAQILEQTSTELSWVRTDVSIVVGGAGTRDHPSQVMLDLVTIVAEKMGVRSPDQIGVIEKLTKREKDLPELRQRIAGILDHLKISFVGDLLHSRVTHDWLHVGKIFNIDINLVAPPVFQIEAFCLTHPKLHCRVNEKLESVHDSDIVYTIRTQRERLEKVMTPSEAEKVMRSMHLNLDFVDSFDGLLMDAQPIDGHYPTMDPSLWTHKKNIMLMQSSFGIPTRMAILRLCESSRMETFKPLELPALRLKKEHILCERSLAEQQVHLKKKYHGQELKLHVVENGFVIDHLDVDTVSLINQLNKQQGLYSGRECGPIFPGEKVPSVSMGRKEVLFVHNCRAPSAQLMATYALIAPNVRISIVDPQAEAEGKPGARRINPPLPKAVQGIFHCPNPRCITNIDPEARTYFNVGGEKGNASLTCEFCEQRFTAQRVIWG